jgi:hypothetical protein
MDQNPGSLMWCSGITEACTGTEILKEKYLGPPTRVLYRLFSFLLIWFVLCTRARCVYYVRVPVSPRVSESEPMIRLPSVRLSIRQSRRPKHRGFEKALKMNCDVVLLVGVLRVSGENLQVTSALPPLERA